MNEICLLGKEEFKRCLNEYKMCLKNNNNNCFEKTGWNGHPIFRGQIAKKKK